MIDLKIIKDDPERISAEVKKRGLKLDVKKLVELDEKRRAYQQQFDELRATQKGIRDATEGKKVKEQLKTLEEESR